MAETPKNMYPKFQVANNKTPNKFLNFPLLGIIIKAILLIPVWIEVFFLGVAAIFFLVYSWIVTSFTGNYSTIAYKYFLGLMRLWTKVKLYIFGVTDKYPGFGLNTNGLFVLDIPKPEKPNRWLAIPLLGFVIRFILLIPYLIFSDVLYRGSNVAMVLSWFVILFKGRLPEPFYEFEKDSLRVNYAANSYLVGLSDSYPSFYISMNHQTAKIILLIVGAILAAFNMFGSLSPDNGKYKSHGYEYGPESTVNLEYNRY